MTKLLPPPTYAEPDKLTHDNLGYILDALDMRYRHLVVSALVSLIAYYNKKTEIGAIVASGGSGLAIAPIVSYITGIPLLIVNKETEESHCEENLRGMATAGDYIIIDDFIDSGKTLNWIIAQVEENCHNPMKCAAILLYRQGQKEVAMSDLYYDNVCSYPVWGMNRIYKKSDKGRAKVTKFKPHRVILSSYPEQDDEEIW